MASVGIYVRFLGCMLNGVFGSLIRIEVIVERPVLSGMAGWQLQNHEQYPKPLLFAGRIGDENLPNYIGGIN